MMTDTAIQQSTDSNGQNLVTQNERQALIQKLNSRWTAELSTMVEKDAYEKSRGVKPLYFKLVQTHCQRILSTQQNRPTLPQTTVQAVNNNRQFPNQQINVPQQQINVPQQPSASMMNHPQHSLNHMQTQAQPRFPSVQTRMTNPPTAMVNNQPAVRLREPPKFIQSPLNSMPYTSTPASIQPMNLPQNYTPQPQPQQINNMNLNDYLSQPLLPQNRYPPNQSSLVPQRPRPTTNPNVNFPSQTSSNNANDILHQFVVGNPPTNSVASPMTNIPSTGDRLLQQILLSNSEVSTNKMPSQTRPTAPSTMSPSMRSTSATNSNLNSSVNSLRASLTSHQSAPSSPIIIMPTPTQTSNVQIQPSTNVTIQQSPLSNNNGLSTNSQIIAHPSSVPTSNQSSSPVNRPTGSISSPDEETSNLIKFFKENITRLQTAYQKFTNEGNLDKARNAQAIQQQMILFINNPTYEGLSSAKHIRDILERALNRPQPASTTAATTTTTSTAANSASVPTIPPVPVPQVNEVNQFEKVVTEYVSSDAKKRVIVNEYFVEPLADVINGVPHKKIRLDFDNNSIRINNPESSTNQLSLISKLNNELSLLPNNRFSIERSPVSHTSQTSELNDEYLNRNGLILRCKLLEQSNPLIPALRLRISTRYPEEPPEILSLINTTPPKLEFSDGCAFFEQLSTIFVSYLFKLPFQYTVTDILNIWYRSVQSAL